MAEFVLYSRQFTVTFIFFILMPEASRKSISREPGSVTWHSLFPDEYCWCAEESDTEVALFHSCSGNILMVTPVAECILKTLQQSPQTPDRLCQTVASVFQLDQDQELHTLVENTLVHFEQLGLVRSTLS